MYPTSFEYVAPKSIGETIELLAQQGEDAKLLAGGQSLVPMMKLRVARPKYLIDINRIPDLAYVREQNGKLHCGAMTRHVQMEESPLIKEKIPMLSQAASVIGDVQVRNRGTLGGALVEADPSGDWGAVTMALNAQMKCAGPRGERLISATDFFTFAYTTALESNEILTEIIFPVPGAGTASTYAKLERVAGDFAIASAAVQMDLDSNGLCRSIGVGVAGSASIPQKAFSVEELLIGKMITPEIISEAGRLVQESADPVEDLRGSAAYKKRALGAVLKRALSESLQKARARKSS
jgi:aerobic carbon-monoxide dehydrogenase medium subunit